MQNFNSGGPFTGNVVQLPIMGQRAGEAILPRKTAEGWPTPRLSVAANMTLDMAVEIVRCPDPARYTDARIIAACEKVKRLQIGVNWQMANELEKAMKKGT